MGSCLGRGGLALLLMLASACTFERRPDRAEQRPPAQAAPRPAEAAAADSVRAVLAAFDAALAAADTAGALALLDSALVVYEGGLVDSTRAAYAARHLPADMEFARGALVRDVLGSQIVVLADAALTLARYHVSGQLRGRPVRSETTETMVLVRTPAGWKVRHIHWSSRRLEATF
ncbi:MAG: nuclear transport factor 2 family protein [Gemmatimonadetes bacterium]|nr:nuclear transport factor 2 family protein [Gemmatimonadota bacterium]